MAAARVVQVADALVEFLAGQAYSEPYRTIRPERLYDPDFKPDQLSEVKVAVVAAGWTQDLGDRDEGESDITLDVAIMKYTDCGRREMDELVLLCEEISGRLLTADLSACGAQAIKAETDPLYSVGDLREDHVFLSVIRVAFKVMYEVP